MQKNLSNILFSKRGFSISSSLILFLLFPFTSIYSQCSDNYVQIGSYHIEFAGVEYDYPNEGQSTWYYTVIATSGKDISHVTFPLNKNCINVLDAGVWGDNFDELYSGLGIPSVGKDPKAKIWGVKFDKGIDKGDERNYYFTIENNLAVEPVHEVAIKAGRPFYKGTVCGPSPDCTEVSDEPLSSCISGMVFHDANKDGIRDSDENSVTGIEVILHSSSGQIGSVWTDGDGNYSFCDLDINTYVVQILSTQSMIATSPNIGSDEFDSDIVSGQFTDLIDIISLGESVTNVDGGYFSFGLWDLGFIVNPNGQNQFSQSKIPDPHGIDLPNTFDYNNQYGLVKNKIEIYPNPVVDQIKFVLPQNRVDDVIIEIRNQRNQIITSLVLSKNEMETRLDFSSLPSGIYFAYIISDQGIEVEKIVKTK